MDYTKLNERNARYFCPFHVWTSAYCRQAMRSTLFIPFDSKCSYWEVSLGEVDREKTALEPQHRLFYLIHMLVELGYRPPTFSDSNGCDLVDGPIEILLGIYVQLRDICKKPPMHAWKTWEPFWGCCILLASRSKLRIVKFSPVRLATSVTSSILDNWSYCYVQVI